MAKRFIPLEIAAENLLRFLHNTELALVERGQQERRGGERQWEGLLETMATCIQNVQRDICTCKGY